MNDTLPRYKVTSRFVLHLGYSCNLRCKFCYYLEELKQGTAKDFPTHTLRRRLRLAYWLGKKAVDLSGGEPTIRKDLPELIRFSQRLGYRDICVITNGQRTANPEYCRKLQQAGLNEGLFSLHGYSPAIHDELTGVGGSFARVLTSLDNFHRLKIRTRVNTVVNNLNYLHLPNLVDILAEREVFALNLIVFNPAETAVMVDSSEASVRIQNYREVGETISDLIDKYRDRFAFINVRFLPFCFLRRHPDAIRTQWQKFFEDQEWDPIMTIGFQKGFGAVLGAFLAGFFYRNHTPKFRPADLWTWANQKVTAFRIREYSYRQNAICRNQCSLSPICTGVQKDFVKKMGFPDFEPIRLETGKIYDPLYFMKEHSAIAESLRCQRKQD